MTETGAFRKFLVSLAPDPDQAAERYEHIRRALIRFFISYQAPDPEACADETFEILQRQVVGDRPIRDIEPYSIGVARNVLMKDRERRRGLVELSVEPGRDHGPRVRSPLSAAVEQTEEMAREKCMNACLRAIPAEEQKLVVQYYFGRKHDKDKREKLARELGVTAKHLRVKVHRLKQTLKERVSECIKKKMRKA